MKGDHRSAAQISCTDQLHIQRAVAFGKALLSAKMLDVLWDMDGVLLDSEPIYLSVESEIVSRYGKDIRTVLPYLLGSRAIDAARITVEQLQIPLTPEEYLRQRDVRLLEEMRSVTFLPGVQRTVQHFIKYGSKCAVATSSPRNLLIAKQTGKKHFFEQFGAVICGDDVQHGKPHPEIFLKAAAAINTQPSNCVVFEDAPKGIRAARLAGMKTVALPNQQVDLKLYQQEQPDFIVPSGSLLDFDPTVLGFPPFA